MELKRGLHCRRLSFAWPGDGTDAPVLAAVDATFPPGSLSLVTGDTGAGKSTLMHLLAALLRPTSGELWADGQPVSRWPAGHRDRWRRQVGIVFQHLALPSDLSVAENLLLPMIPGDLSWSQIQDRIRTQLEAVDMAALAAAPAGALSGGQRQRVAIARAFMRGPRFLLADEPTAFQDDRQTDRIIALLKQAAENGAVVIVCSHDTRLRQATAVDRHYHLAAATLTCAAAQEDAP